MKKTKGFILAVIAIAIAAAVATAIVVDVVETIQENKRVNKKNKNNPVIHQVILVSQYEIVHILLKIVSYVLMENASLNLYVLENVLLLPRQ